jgi:predicted metalloprotease
MRYDIEHRSDNVDDRRQRWLRPAAMIFGGAGAAGALVLATASLLPSNAPPQPPAEANVVATGAAKPSESAPSVSAPAGAQKNDDAKDFVAAILGDTELVWRDWFTKTKRTYREPRLVIFQAQIETGCGAGRSELGPFYCASDEKIYIDPAFFGEMADRYKAPGDFARAYVIAHEVGHHVQNLLGTAKTIRQEQQKEKGKGTADAEAEAETDDVTRQLELHADMLAGFWAHHAQKARQILEPGDVEAALKAITAFSEDHPELAPAAPKINGAYTRCWSGPRGTAAEKVKWFERGLKSGELD